MMGSEHDSKSGADVEMRPNMLQSNLQGNSFLYLIVVTTSLLPNY